MINQLLMAAFLMSISLSSYASTKHCMQNNEKSCNQTNACEWNTKNKKCVDKKTSSSPKTDENHNPNIKAEDLLKDTTIEEPEEAPGN